MSIDTTLTYRLSPSVHTKKDGNGLLVLDPTVYAVHELNESAALVAQLCNGQNSCEKIVATIVESHGEDPSTAARIVYQGLALLQEKGLLETA